MVILTIIIGLANSLRLWIIGAAFWGLTGIILFLPFAAMLKVVCEEFEELKPITLIIVDKNKKEDDGIELFLSRW
jgi:predicted PurR-regulated permease PerM